MYGQISKDAIVALTSNSRGAGLTSLVATFNVKVGSLQIQVN